MEKNLGDYPTLIEMTETAENVGLQPENNDEFRTNLARLKKLQKRGSLPTVENDIQLRGLAAMSTWFHNPVPEVPNSAPETRRSNRSPLQPDSKAGQIRDYLREVRSSDKGLSPKELAEALSPDKLATRFGTTPKYVRKVMSRAGEIQ